LAWCKQPAPLNPCTGFTDYLCANRPAVTLLVLCLRSDGYFRSVCIAEVLAAHPCRALAPSSTTFPIDFSCGLPYSAVDSQIFSCLFDRVQRSIKPGPWLGFWLSLCVFHSYFCAAAPPGNSAPRYLFVPCSVDSIASVIRLVEVLAAASRSGFGG
jgi:hypothetical protein